VTVGAAQLRIVSAPMSAATRADAQALLSSFLGDDPHYRASAGAYGDGGAPALAAALDLFLGRPELGFVWLARIDDGRSRPVVGACVCCYAISTSRGTLVGKLDDVTIAAGWQGRGVGAAMLRELAAYLADRDVTRIDCGCHRDNAGAWRFYERLGFRPLDEERIALVLEGPAANTGVQSTKAVR
jgi:ribosomal protein S18 acetylase RimI-like enzyme